MTDNAEDQQTSTLAKEEDKDADVDFFWDVIKRYDTYYVSVNTKATVIITFNTFLLTAVSLKFQDILCRYKDLVVAQNILYGAAFIMTVASIASIYMAFYAIHPFRKTNQDDGSVIFFGNVAKLTTPEKYLSRYLEVKPRLREDISAQTHILAKGLCTKFKWISNSIIALGFELACLLLIVSMFIFSSAINTCN